MMDEKLMIIVNFFMFNRMDGWDIEEHYPTKWILSTLSKSFV